MFHRCNCLSVTKTNGGCNTENLTLIGYLLAVSLFNCQAAIPSKIHCNSNNASVFFQAIQMHQLREWGYQSREKKGCETDEISPL